MPSNDEDLAAIKAAYFRTWKKNNSEARKAYMREYAQKNRETINENKRRYREANREKLRAAHHAYIRDEHGELSAAYKERHQRKLVQNAADLETMAGRPRPKVCDACGGPPDKGKSLHYDHCHKHGHFRGWICRECNLALGNVRDDPARLLKLVAYLKRTVRSVNQFALPGV